MTGETTGAAPELDVRIADHLHGFLRDLHDNGIGVSVPKQRDFLRAVELTHPRGEGELYWIAAATLTTSQRSRDVFDAVFAHWFEAAPPVDVAESIADETGPAPAGRDGDEDFATARPADDDGLAASRASTESRRHFPATDDADREDLRHVARAAASAIPTIRSRRRRTARRGPWLDVRRVCRESRRTDGEIVTLRWRDRPRRQRRVLLLIDVSGSMKRHSAAYLRLAHAMVAGCERAEAFTFGTRLTRVTDQLRTRDVDDALRSLSEIVLDVDGGTMIGHSLQEFLGNERYVTTARGAVVIVLSDGLERGDCGPMRHAVRRLSLLGNRLLWWSPLAVDPRYTPSTRGMALAVEHLDALAGVDDLASARVRLEAGLDRTAANVPRVPGRPGAHEPGGAHA